MKQYIKIRKTIWKFRFSQTSSIKINAGINIVKAGLESVQKNKDKRVNQKSFFRTLQINATESAKKTDSE